MGLKPLVHIKGLRMYLECEDSTKGERYFPIEAVLTDEVDTLTIEYKVGPCELNKILKNVEGEKDADAIPERRRCKVVGRLLRGAKDLCQRAVDKVHGS